MALSGAEKSHRKLSCLHFLAFWTKTLTLTTRPDNRQQVCVGFRGLFRFVLASAWFVAGCLFCCLPFLFCTFQLFFFLHFLLQLCSCQRSSERAKIMFSRSRTSEHPRHTQHSWCFGQFKQQAASKAGRKANASWRTV